MDPQPRNRLVVRAKRLVARWERVVDSFRRWRWERAEPERLSELRNYRTPIQVCPRGCEHHEAARLDVLTRTAFWGRVEMRVTTTFETSKCPSCGAQLVRFCDRCKSEIFAAVERCQSCGRPQPWAAERRVAAERAGVRKWRSGSKGVRDSARELYDAGRGRELLVIDGDLTRLEVDAVVSNVDVYGQMWAEG